MQEGIRRLATLEFCPKCKKVLLPDMEKGKLACRTCGFEKPFSETRLYTERTLKPKRTIVLGDSKRHITNRLCPKCGNDKAYVWRHGISKENAPEPSNWFYKCTRCGNAWKEM
jgi:DNA-directed RNA polymerase subunit M